ncbi:MAG: hypothetical protein N2Z85_01280, partial [Patescibacteria group bacterium]|nr:hypothetical protein [Patescibacteria group bacterium]
MNNNFKKSLIINIIIIIFVFSLTFFIIKYFEEVISKKTTEIENFRKNNIFFTNSLSNLAKIKETSLQADLYQSKLYLLLPKKDELIDLPSWIADVARATQVRVNFSFKGESKEPTSNNPGYESFIIDINGTLPNIEKFLYNIEAISPKFILTIDNFNILDVGGGNYQFSAIGKVFFR